MCSVEFCTHCMYNLNKFVSLPNICRKLHNIYHHCYQFLLNANTFKTFFLHFFLFTTKILFTCLLVESRSLYLIELSTTLAYKVRYRTRDKNE